jgi:RimJ/RimL family protein N-acetyltransferase
MQLKTERLVLRQFAETDFAALCEIAADPEVLRYRRADVISEERTRDFLRHAQTAPLADPQLNFPFAIVLAESNRLIGECGLTRLEAEQDEAFLWYSLNRHYWGQGYATEAARALVRFGLIEVGLHRISAGCHAENIASQRVLEKIGFRLAGRVPVTDGLRFNLQRNEFDEAK